VGSLSDCIQFGIPKEILIPLLPVTESFGGKGHGKAPAQFDPATGKWRALDEWQRGGHSGDILRNSEAAGGNAGVILGAPYAGLQMLAVDIDLNDGPKALGWRHAIVHALQRMWGQTILVRETWPHRALLLVNIPVDADPGAKKKFTISYADPGIPDSKPVEIGKIELLARGQQAAIAGTHISGNPMAWYFLAADQETERYPAPPVKLNIGAPNEKITLPVFSTFDELAVSVVNLLDAMAPHGFSYTALSLTAGGNGPPPPIANLAAPSAGELADLLDQTPNPASVDRDVYANFMMAISGARAGLVAVRGALSVAEEDLIAHAVAGWASRWVAPPGSKTGTFDEELAKWRGDFGRPRDENFAGWRQFMLHCQAFGAPATALRDIAMQNAQAQFTADTSRPPPPDEIPGQNVLNATQMGYRQGVNPTLVATTDMAVAERLLQFFSGNAVWVPATGSWLVWVGAAGWKSDEVTSAKVGVLISDRLWWYVGKYGNANPAQGQAGWGDRTMNLMLSAGKMNRVAEILKMHLAKASSEINLGTYRLQTPQAMYDLSTLQPVEIMQRKALHETRSTLIEPTRDIGDTPYFDKLTLDLCDGNEEVREWLLHYIGYCMMGAPGEAVFVVIWGAGGNGKSTLVSVLNRILGNYAVSLDAKVIMESGENQHPASLNRLRHKRLAMISEPKKGAKWNERILKMITGGDDIEARDMGKNPTPFRSQAGLLIVSNEKPRFESVEPAIQRRFRMINTVIRRNEDEIIKDFEELIMAEAPAVLRKLMTYAQKVYHAKGLPKQPAAMKAFAAETLSQDDVIFAWLQAECDYGTADTKNEEELVEELRLRCENYMKRNRDNGGGGEFTADKITPRAFLERMHCSPTGCHVSRYR
jgi:P4 family phage/plasmid primase-like protien